MFYSEHKPCKPTHPLSAARGKGEDIFAMERKVNWRQSHRKATPDPPALEVALSASLLYQKS